MSAAPVAVVGAGVKAPGGTTVDELWRFLCDGRSSAVPYRDERLGDDAKVLVSPVTGFDPAAYLQPAELRRYDRAHQLAIGAAQDAWDGLGVAATDLLGGIEPDRAGVVCGVGFGATATYEHQHAQLLERGLRGLSPLVIPMVMPNATAALLSLRFGLRGPCLTVSSACASGATAIGEGVELVRRGAADVVLAGGVDAMLTYNALCSFLRLDVMSRNVEHPELASRPFDIDRDGFVMAEGAGFVVLQRLADAVADRRTILGVIAGYGTNADAHHLVAPGHGARRCMELALADAGLARGDVAHVNSHGTATRLNDDAEAAAIDELFGTDGPPVTAVKGATGHLIAGSGAVETIVTLRSAADCVVPPVAGLRTIDPTLRIDAVQDRSRPIPPGYGLTNSFGFGGANACLVVGPA